MPQRETMNVSLPPAQEQFVRDQVASGRYQTASEVVREGLRLLEREEWKRLIEKELSGGLTDEERARVPDHVWDKLRAHFDEILKRADDDAAAGRLHDGEELMARLRQRVQSKRKRKSA
ncbi:MAG TPA: type II toxin-antitoxin system ParD family antitoxin [Phycisphaerales bacterium]|nr:type II toxin-antitoxin system ParD family antitoxin [Phycisphaerales bacterium]